MIDLSDPSTIGTKLRVLRLIEDLSRPELARKAAGKDVKLAETLAHSLKNWEEGTTSPSFAGRIDLVLAALGYQLALIPLGSLDEVTPD